MSNIASPAPAYRDRSAGLVLFGAIHILLGVLCVILLLGIASGSEIAARGGVPPKAMLAQSLAVYGALAFYFFVAGIRSIRARRWARAVFVATIIAVTAILDIILPLAFILFYRSPQVAATFASRTRCRAGPIASLCRCWRWSSSRPRGRSSSSRCFPGPSSRCSTPSSPARRR